MPHPLLSPRAMPWAGLLRPLRGEFFPPRFTKTGLPPPSSFPGSAWEAQCPQAPPAFPPAHCLEQEAEPRQQCVPGGGPGERGEQQRFGVRWLATALAAPNRPNAESSAFVCPVVALRAETKSPPHACRNRGCAGGRGLAEPPAGRPRAYRDLARAEHAAGPGQHRQRLCRQPGHADSEGQGN